MFFLSPKLLSCQSWGQQPGLYPPFWAHKFPGLFALKATGPSLQPEASRPEEDAAPPRMNSREPLASSGLFPVPARPPLCHHLPLILTHTDIWVYGKPNG